MYGKVPRIVHDVLYNMYNTCIQTCGKSCVSLQHLLLRIIRVMNRDCKSSAITNAVARCDDGLRAFNKLYSFQFSLSFLSNLFMYL